MHSESICNPSEYRPNHVSKLYILISRWDAPVTPQGHECCTAQKEEQDRERAAATQMHGPMSVAGSPDIRRISHTSSSQVTNTHNPLNNSLARRGQPQYHARSVHRGPVTLDDDSIMDETETNSAYNADSYLSGNANEFDGLSECLHTSHPRQAETQKWPQY